MRRFWILVLAAAFLCACEKQAEPTAVDFSCDRIAPLMFQFTNLSTGCTEYRWDFGDGSWAIGEDAMHAYAETGTYTVTLSGTTVDGRKYDCRQTVAVTMPDVYIAGVRYYSIPYENRYYKVVFKDDNLLPSSWDFQTNYTPMLDESYLPYLYQFSTPRLIENMSSHSYYSIQVFRTTNAANNNNDVSCTKQQLLVSDLLQFLPEYILQTESGSTAIGVLMQYRY